MTTTLSTKLRTRYRMWLIGGIVAVVLVLVLIVVIVLLRKYRKPNIVNSMDLHGVAVSGGWGDF